MAARMMHLSRAEAEGFYAVHKARPFFNDLVSFMISGPVMIQVLEGEDAIQKNRDLMGATDPRKAAKHYRGVLERSPHHLGALEARMREDAHVIVITGDGDGLAIGGNHLIHAARRNMDIKVICANNFIYGMAGGQGGPTTPMETWTTTTPYGNIEQAFNLVHLAAACGAVYVARWTTLQTRWLTESIKKALQKEGFSFVEIISACPEIFGRYNKMDTALKMMKWFKEASVVQNFSDPANAEITPNRIIVGEFVDIEKPSYGRLLKEMRTKAAQKKTGE